MKPEARIESAAGLSEQSVELARWVCIATRIDPALIRRARLTLSRGADAGVESDLWFGPLVQTAGARYILFYPEVADLLRRQLAENRRDLARAWRVTRRIHRGLPELVRLEEKLTWLALKGGPRLERSLDALLRPLIKAMLTGQREGLGRWALNVLPHMPEAVRVSKSARLLRVVAESQLYGGWTNLLTTAGEGPTDEEAALLLHGLERTSAGLRLTGDRLEVSEPPEDYSRIIKVPATSPRVLEVTWPGVGDTHAQSRLTWRKGERAYAHHVTLPATISTLAGDTHRLVDGGKVKREAPSLIFVVNDARQTVGMAFMVENNFVITTLRSIQGVVNPKDFYSDPVTLRFPDLVYDDYASAEIVKAGSTREGPVLLADRPILLKLSPDERWSDLIDYTSHTAKLKSAFDFVGKVLAAPGLPPDAAAHRWATFEVGAMTEAGEFALIPATQIRPEELARWSGAPLIDVSTGHVAGVTLFLEDKSGPRLTLFSLNQITHEFPEIFNNAGSTVLVSYSHQDRNHLEEFRARMEAAGLGDRLNLWDDTDTDPEGQWRWELEHVAESAAAIVMFLSTTHLDHLVVTDVLPPLLARAEERGTLILPLIVSASPLEQTALARYRAFNDPPKPLATMSDEERERVYAQLTELLSRRLGLKADAREEPRIEARYDFFISYAKEEAAWAEWIAWELEEAGYFIASLQPWDFRPGFGLPKIQELMKEFDRVIVLLSSDYLLSELTQSEWLNALAANLMSSEEKLVPVRVREVSPTGLLAQLVSIDLVGLSEQDARAALLGGISASRLKGTKIHKLKNPDERVPFPGEQPTPPPVPPWPQDPPGEFTIDVFVSYAQSDNEPHESSRGWVNQFTRHLRTRLLQLLGEEVTIWQDTTLRGNQFFIQQTAIALSKSRLFVAVVTPDYLKSEWCLRELREFALRAGQTGGVLIGGRSRIFTVLKSAVPYGEMTYELWTMPGYEFFERDAERARARDLMPSFTHESEMHYREKLEDLARDIAETLKALKHGASETRPVEERKDNVNNAVYLAETTRDVRQQREEIRRELVRRGYRVLPDKELEMFLPAFDEDVRESIDRCGMSVHLFGQRYGAIPEGSRSRSVAHRQLELAAERASSDPNFVRLVWMPPGLEPADERQGALVRELQAGVGDGSGTELIQAELETLKTRMLERLSRLV